MTLLSRMTRLLVCLGSLALLGCASQADLKKAQDERDQFKTSLDRATQERDAAQKQVEVFQTQAKATSQNLSEAETKLAAAEARATKAEADAKAAGQSLTLTQNELRAAQEKASAAAKAQKDLADAQTQLATAERANTELRDQLKIANADKQKALQDVTDLRKRISDLEAAPKAPPATQSRPNTSDQAP